MLMNCKELRGFSLIELIVVITILVLLAGLVIPLVSGMITDGRISRVTGDLRMFKSACAKYRADIGNWPQNRALDQDNGLVSKGNARAGDQPIWKGPYLERWPKSPWSPEGAYEVHQPEQKFDLDGDGAVEECNLWLRRDNIIATTLQKIDKYIDDNNLGTGMVRDNGDNVWFVFYLGED